MTDWYVSEPDRRVRLDVLTDGYITADYLPSRMATGDPEDALSESGDETLVAFDVTPGASGTTVPSGFNEWRSRFEARLAEPARDGRANAELVDEMSELLDAQARLAQGASSSKKTVAVTAPRERVLRTLTDALES